MPNISQHLEEIDGESESPCTPDEEAVLLKKGFTILDKLNYGSFSKVYKARYQGKDIAVKVIDLRQTSRDYRKKFLPRELEIMQRLRHPNIITIHKIFTMNKKIYVFMDLATGGDILEYLKQNGPIPEHQAKVWFKQVAEALRYIHSHGVAHRDLKSENILLDSEMNAKLTDFGFCRTCFDRKTGKGILSETYCGSAAYVAPEVLKSTPYNPVLSDIWSLGVVLFVMVNNALPFDDQDLSKMVTLQVRRQWHFSHKVDKRLSNNLKDLIRLMLEPDLNKRPNIGKVFKHPWLKDTPKGPRPTGSARVEKIKRTTLSKSDIAKLPKQKEQKSNFSKTMSATGIALSEIVPLPKTTQEISKEIGRVMPLSPTLRSAVLPNIMSIQIGEARKVLMVSSADPKSDVEFKKSRNLIEGKSENDQSCEPKVRPLAKAKPNLTETLVAVTKKILVPRSIDEGVIIKSNSASPSSIKDDSAPKYNSPKPEL